MLRLSTVPLLGAIVVALPFLAGAAHADPAETAMLGRDPGAKSAYACFARQYDAVHMASHPRQNVRDIRMLFSSLTDDAQKRTDNITLGFKFKGVKRPIEASGDCSTIDGETGLTCSIDCDGGNFKVTTSGATGAVVAIPDPISMWDPASTDEDDPNAVPKGAELGADDKDFSLQRVDLSQCGDLMSDEDKANISGGKTAAKP